MQQQQWWKNVHTGMNVCDRDGKNIGTIENVEQPGLAMGGQQRGDQGHVQVKCNLPNLRNELYIPFDSFRDCTGDTCYLNVSENEISRQGWDRRPTNL